MATEKKKLASVDKEHVVVKNKKFKKSDILAFGICLVVALIIWIYATNVQMNDAKELEKLQEELKTTQQA